MPVTLINGFVLFSHPADWSEAPAWSRAWETGMAASITGAEQRNAMRNLPRVKLSYLISALSLEERAVLDERLDAASKSGLACCPFIGRGSVLAAGANANAAVLTENSWGWQPGDFVFLQTPNAPQSAYLNFDAIEVTAVNGLTLTLAGNVSRNYPAGSLTWPLLFGKFAMEEQTANTSWHGDVKITVSELTPRGAQALGNVPAAPGPGVGGWKVATTLVIQ